MTRDKMNAILNAIKTIRAASADEIALAGKDLYPAWKPDTVYAAGDRVLRGETLYRCLQAHESQEGWIPELLPALWREISLEEWPEWLQPTGAEDAYDLGDKVSHNGKRWISNVSNNVWEPGVYGWSEAV